MSRAIASLSVISPIQEHSDPICSWCFAKFAQGTPMWMKLCSDFFARFRLYVCYPTFLALPSALELESWPFCLSGLFSSTVCFSAASKAFLALHRCHQETWSSFTGSHSYLDTPIISFMAPGKAKCKLTFPFALPAFLLWLCCWSLLCLFAWQSCQNRLWRAIGLQLHPSLAQPPEPLHALHTLQPVYLPVKVQDQCVSGNLHSIRDVSCK